MNAVHIALPVTDIEGAERFYRAFLGTEPVKRRPGYVKFVTQEPPLNLALSQRAGARGQRAHFGIQVASTEEVDRAAQRLRAAGLITAEERDADCCYALQDKVWVHDPDGNAWEVFTVKADTWTAEPAGDMAQEGVARATCC